MGQGWGNGVARALAGLTLAALLAAPLLSSPTHVAASVAKVCGGLVPDADFQSEVDALGTSHACEHLKGRHADHLASSAMVAPAAQLPTFSALAADDPAVVGSWTSPVNPGTKTVGISAVLFHTGKVLLFGGKYKSTDKNTAAYLFDPVTGTGHEVPAPAAVFCGSVTQISDGRVLSAGGANPIPKGIVDLWLFDPVSEAWVRQPDTPLGRYYPTSTKLADGRIIIAAGSELNGTTKNPTVELYTPPAPGGSLGTLQVVGPPHVTAYYPHQRLMPDGRMLQLDGAKAYRLDPAGWTWSSLVSAPFSPGRGAASIALPAGPGGSTKVLEVGGLKSGAARTTTLRLDYATPGWTQGNQMPTPRAHMNLVQVPDGSAYGIGGNAQDLYNLPEYQTLFYDPATDRWSNMAIQSPRRAYHSTAMLLPDGRIMSAGDSGSGGGRQLIDFYSPPYLFKGPRPDTPTAPAQVGYGTTFQIGTSGPAVTRAVLMAPAATTHAVEMNARHVELAVTPAAGGFTAVAPAAQVAPPGYYMLFTVTADGIPSQARWVHLGP